MAHLRAQAVVAASIGNRLFSYLQMGLNRVGGIDRSQAVEHILDMLGAGIARFEHQFNGNQHGLQTSLGNRSQYLAITLSPPSRLSNRARSCISGSGMSANGAPLRKAPGLRSMSGM